MASDTFFSLSPDFKGNMDLKNLIIGTESAGENYLEVRVPTSVYGPTTTFPIIRRDVADFAKLVFDYVVNNSPIGSVWG